MRVVCEIIKDLEGMFLIGEVKTLKKETAKSLELKGYLKILNNKQNSKNKDARMVDKIEVELNVFEL
jgi:hypothetical protein